MTDKDESEKTTAEGIAYRLYEDIASNEGMSTSGANTSIKPKRDWILNTYAECLLAVRAPNTRLKR